MAKIKKKKGKEVTDEDSRNEKDIHLTQKNLLETERFVKRMEIQKGIIKKIIPPIQDTSTNKNFDK